MMAEAQAQVITLHPGDVGYGERGDRLETLLGSCVAIVLTDPRRTVGAMCHIVHARPSLQPQRADGTHGAEAIRRMFALLMLHGITPRLCEAYVYGGGNMFPDLVRDGHVGQNNARWALDALAREGIRVLLADLGGARYRKLSWTVGFDAPSVEAVQV